MMMTTPSSGPFQGLSPLAGAIGEPGPRSFSLTFIVCTWRPGSTTSQAFWCRDSIGVAIPSPKLARYSDKSLYRVRTYLCMDKPRQKGETHSHADTQTHTQMHGCVTRVDAVRDAEAESWSLPSRQGLNQKWTLPLLGPGCALPEASKLWAGFSMLQLVTV